MLKFHHQFSLHSWSIFGRVFAKFSSDPSSGCSVSTFDPFQEDFWRSVVPSGLSSIHFQCAVCVSLLSSSQIRIWSRAVQRTQLVSIHLSIFGSITDPVSPRFRPGFLFLDLFSSGSNSLEWLEFSTNISERCRPESLLITSSFSHQILNILESITHLLLVWYLTTSVFVRQLPTFPLMSFQSILNIFLYSLMSHFDFLFHFLCFFIFISIYLIMLYLFCLVCFIFLSYQYSRSKFHCDL